MAILYLKKCIWTNLVMLITTTSIAILEEIKQWTKTITTTYKNLVQVDILFVFWLLIFYLLFLKYIYIQILSKTSYFELHVESR